jgi:hypothetical protein
MADTDNSSPILRYNLVSNTVEYFNGADWYPADSDPAGGVTSFNTLTGDVTISAGSNITLTPSGNNIAISSTGGGSGASPNFVQVTQPNNFDSNATNVFQPSSVLTLTITPSSNTAQILINFSTNVYSATAGAEALVTIFRNSSNLAATSTMGFGVAQAGGIPAGTGSMVSGSFIDAPATTSSVTYTLYFCNTDNTSIVLCGNPSGAITAVLSALEIH